MRFAIIFVGATLGCSGLIAQHATQSAPVRVSSGVMAGLAIRTVEPVFPREAIDARVNGAVVCSVVIGKDGKVRDATVISGPEMLRKNYLEAIRQWEYRPYVLNGQPVEVITQITLTIQMGAPSSPDATAVVAPGNVEVPPPALPAALPPGHVRVSSGVMAGQKLSGGMPNFCLIAGQERVNGTVSLHVVVDRTGSVSEAHVISGAAVLRQAATEAVRGWMFKPYPLNGDPVEVETTVTISESCGS
jgi:TonB family protein